MNLGIGLAALVAFIVGYLVLSRRSSIRNIPGPHSHSWIFGNMLEMVLASPYGKHEVLWQKAYGSVFKFKGCFGQDRLMVSDPLAVQYIVNSSHFSLSPGLQTMAGMVLGDNSMLGLRGQAHKRIRNEFNIGFTAAAVRNYQPIFEKLAHAISQQLEASDTSLINIVPLVGAATVGAIAEAALGYSLEELGEAYLIVNAEITTGAAYQSAGDFFARTIMLNIPTWLSRAAINLPTKTFKMIHTARDMAIQLGERVVQGKQDLTQGGLDIDSDVFGLLLDPHHSDTTREKLTSEEIVSQTATIMIAGQETTTNTIVFGLLELAKNAEFQDMLRAEIHFMAGAGGNVAYDSMPLLNAFIKESLRFYPAAPLTERMALEDTVIPLSESITTSTGEIISQISVEKGQIVVWASQHIKRHKSRWGENPQEFRPVIEHLRSLAFLGGPHTCLGLLEMQVLICELVGKFSFALPEDDSNPVCPTMSNGERGAPLRVTRIL
ncbi:cytochrome P450 [Mycena haematopus]|nr:cytochrome P450 [Mycena haematopus]